MIDAGLLPRADPLFDLGGVLAYLVPVLFLSLGRTRRRRPTRRRSIGGPAAAVTGALVVVSLLVVGCASSSAASPAGSGIPGAIRVAASEYKFEPATLTVPSGGTTFELVNSGTTEHEFQILRGSAVLGTIKPVAPGKTGHVTVDLTAGDYTYVCRIAGHDGLGMKGALSVSGG